MLGKAAPKSKLTVPSKPLWGYAILVMLFVTPWLYYKAPMGIMDAKPNLAKKTLDNFRGHPHFLAYHGKATGVPPQGGNFVEGRYLLKSWVELWQINPHGLGLLPHLDLSSFKMALSDFLAGRTISILRTKSFGTDLNLHLEPLMSFDFGRLSLFNQKKKTVTTINILTDHSYKVVPVGIFRSQLERQDESYPQHALEEGNLLRRPEDRGLHPAPFTSYFFAQYGEFLRTTFFALVFLFVLASIYLNSFVRALIVVAIGFVSNSLFLLWKVAVGPAVHLDSLWLTQLTFWISTACLFFISRSLDIERTRGNDRDDVINEVTVNFVPVVKGAFIYFALSLLVCGLFDFLFFKQNMNFFLDGIWVGIALLIIGLLTCNHLFRLYYLVAQIFIDKMAIKFLLLWYRFKRRKRVQQP